MKDSLTSRIPALPIAAVVLEVLLAWCGHAGLRGAVAMTFVALPLLGAVVVVLLFFWKKWGEVIAFVAILGLPMVVYEYFHEREWSTMLGREMDFDWADASLALIALKLTLGLIVYARWRLAASRREVVNTTPVAVATEREFGRLE